MTACSTRVGVGDVAEDEAGVVGGGDAVEGAGADEDGEGYVAEAVLDEPEGGGHEEDEGLDARVGVDGDLAGVLGFVIGLVTYVGVGGGRGGLQILRLALLAQDDAGVEIWNERLDGGPQILRLALLAQDDGLVGVGGDG